jgi:hypothetical protein
MFLLTELQIDRIVGHRRAFLVSGLALMVVPFFLPRGWGIGFFSGFLLLSLGIYGAAFQKWRSEPGLWMLAVLLTATLGPFWAYLQYRQWRRVLLQAPVNPGGRVDTWDQFRLSVDTGIALFLLTTVVRFAMSVAIENRHRSRVMKQENAETSDDRD